MEPISSFPFRDTVTGRYRVQKPSNPHSQELEKNNDRLVATGALIFIYLATHLLFSTRRRLLKVQSLSVTCGGEEITTPIRKVGQRDNLYFNPLNPELNPIFYLLALLSHHFLHVSRIRVKSLTIRLLMSYIYIYGAPILDVSRSHTTTQHSR